MIIYEENIKSQQFHNAPYKLLKYLYRKRPEQLAIVQETKS